MRGAKAPVFTVELGEESLARLAVLVAPAVALLTAPDTVQRNNGPKPKPWTEERLALARALWLAGLEAQHIWPHLVALPGPPVPNLAALRARGRVRFGRRNWGKRGRLSV